MGLGRTEILVLLIAGTIAAVISGRDEACTEIFGPRTLSSSGHYCLVADIVVSAQDANGITVMADNVTINMRGMSLIGPGGSTLGAGVAADGVRNLVVRTGQVSGFLYGIRVEPNGARVPADTTIRNVDASNNSFRGIRVAGTNSLLEYNRVSGIEGFSGFPSSHSVGIEVSGSDCVIRHNLIGDILPYREGEGVGISVTDEGTGCEIHDNFVRMTPSTYGRTIALWFGGEETVGSVHDNVLLWADYGILGFSRDGDPNGNYIRDACEPWGIDPADPLFTQNDYALTGAQCTDTVDFLEDRVAANPTVAEWHFRLGMAVKGRLGDLGRAAAHFDDACALRLEEGCRQRDLMM